MKPGVAVRAEAADSLGRVLRQGAYSNVVVRRAASTMESRDAGIFQHLVYTALRTLVRIDRTLTAAADRPLDTLDPVVLDVLRIAIVDLLYSSTPDYGAVDSAVEVVRETAGSRPTGFVNAVLRRIARDGEPELPGGAEGAALAYGVAPWLWTRLSATWGEPTAARFLEASNHDAPIGIRSRRPNDLPGTPVAGIADATYLASADGLAAAVTAGDVIVIDPASTAVAAAVGAAPGQVICDLAAAPGGKTVHLWDDLAGDGTLVAADRHRRRLGSARSRLAAIQVVPAWLLQDGTRPALRPDSFDRVLLDAPCTGLGTLRRRPEIRHRLRPDSAKRMAAVQRDLLDAALGLVRPDGYVVYSVCTVFPEETADLVAGYEAAAPVGLPGKRWGKGLLLAPHLTGTDAMFISVVRRSGGSA